MKCFLVLMIFHHISSPCGQGLKLWNAKNASVWGGGARVGALGPKASNPGSGCSQPLAPETLFEARWLLVKLGETIQFNFICWIAGCCTYCTLLQSGGSRSKWPSYVWPSSQLKKEVTCGWSDFITVRSLSSPTKLKRFTDKFSKLSKKTWRYGKLKF